MSSLSLVPMIMVNGLEVTHIAMQQTTPETGWDTSGTLVGQILIFLTTVAGFIYNIYVTNRNRKWDLEDRMLAREALTKQLTENTMASTEAAAKARDLQHQIEELQTQFNRDLDAKLTHVSRTAQKTLDIVEHQGVKNDRDGENPKGKTPSRYP